jgi:hypothetical protein
MLLQQVIDRRSLPYLCLQEKVAYRQIVRVVVKYMDQHPEETHRPFASIIERAVQEAWCKP